MEIRIGSLLEGAANATGAVAIIDVLRAFTTAAVALDNGAEKIIMVGSIEEALSLRANGVGRFCMGETGGRRPAAFDFGNSPYELSVADVRNATIIQRTSAGTQGIVSATQATRLFAASLVTASATARALRAAATDRITVVAMGSSGVDRTDEDELCAMHLRNLLEGRQGDPEAIRQLILAGGEALRFHDINRPDLDPRDLEIAVDVDRYDFAIRVDIVDGRPIGRIDLPQ